MAPRYPPFPGREPARAHCPGRHAFEGVAAWLAPGGGLLRGARLAGAAFLAAAFLAGAAFLAAGGHTPLASLGAVLGVMTASLNPLRGVTLAFFDALTCIISPVKLLRRVPALVSRMLNFAKP